MEAFFITRWVVLLITFIFSIVVLGISADLISIRTNNYWPFAALAVAVSSLTILTFPIMLVLGAVMKPSFVSIIIESLWLSIMWILWLSTGANATRAARARYAIGACSFVSTYSSKICNEFRVVEAFSYMIFIILLSYTLGSFAYAFSHSTDEDEVWGTRGGRGDAARQKGPETGQVQPPTQQATKGS